MWRDTRNAQSIARYASRLDTLATRTRVRTASVPSAMQSDIWRASARFAIRSKQVMRRTNVRGSNAHIARSTDDEKRCPEKPTSVARSACCACGSNASNAKVECSEHKCATCSGELEPKGRNHRRITRWHNAMDATERAYNGRVHLSTMLRHGS